MSLLDQIIGIFAPHNCLGCGTEASLLCLDCRNRLPVVPERCYRCRKVSEAGRTCLVCRRSSKLHSVHIATVYEGVAKDLIWQLKFQGAQAAVMPMAACMQPLAPITEVVIVPVPTSTSRARRRSYDQAKLLARQLAKQTRLPYADCLARSGQAHQVGATRRERLTQLATAFRVTQQSVKGNHLLLVDDVVTTGATLEAAATVLKAAGAKRVDAVVFAQP